jgi:hypothetical protein
MIKVIAALPRRADKTLEEFQHHWGTTHREHALALDRISRYVQSHRRDLTLTGTHPSPYDGFPEVWFPDLDTALGLGTDPVYLAGANVDEREFADQPRIVRTWVTPQVVRTWAGYRDAKSPTKILMLLTCEATAEACESIVAAAVELAPVRLAAGVAVDDERVRERQGFGVVAELWFVDETSALTAWERDGAAFLTRVSPVVDPATSVLALVEEKRARYPGAVPEED